MRTFGECSVELDGQRRILRGEAEIMNAGLEAEVSGNADGTVYQTAKTKPTTLKISLEDAVDTYITVRDMITAKDITFLEEMAGVTHYFNAAKIHGEPSTDPATGAVTGITFACARADYRRQAG